MNSVKPAYANTATPGSVVVTMYLQPVPLTINTPCRCGTVDSAEIGHPDAGDAGVRITRETEAVHLKPFTGPAPKLRRR